MSSNYDRSDAMTVDSWGGRTEITTATTATQQHLIVQSDDGSYYYCMKHPDAMPRLTSQHSLCPHCESDFRLQRKQLEERRQTIQSQLQDLAAQDGADGTTSFNLSGAGADIMKELESSLQQWKPLPAGAATTENGTSANADVSSGSAQHSMQPPLSVTVKSRGTNGNSGSLPPRSPASHPPLPTTQAQAQAPTPSAPHPYVPPGAAGNGAPHQQQQPPVPPYANMGNPAAAAGPPGAYMGNPAAGGFDALAGQFTRMQQLQDWVLWQKEQECANLHKKLDEANALIQQLRVDNALLTEKLHQQEQRMQHELKLIKLAAYQKLAKQQQQQQVAQQQQVVQQHHHHQQQQQQLPSYPQIAAEPAQVAPTQQQAYQPTNGGSAVPGMISTSSSGAPAPAPVASTKAKPPPAEAYYSNHSNGFANRGSFTSQMEDLDAPQFDRHPSETSRRDDPKPATSSSNFRDSFSQNGSMGGDGFPDDFQTNGNAFAATNSGAKRDQQNRAAPSAHETQQKPWETKPWAAPSGEQPQQERTRNTHVDDETEDGTNVYLDDEPQEDPVQEEPAPRNGVPRVVEPSHKLQTEISALSMNLQGHTLSDKGKVTGISFQAAPPTSEAQKKLSFADDNMSHGRTAETSTYGEDREQVKNKVVYDPYGDKGHYTGLVLKSTGLPHGQGKMIYQEDNRTYEGEWRHGRWHGFGAASFANGDEYEGEYRYDQRHGRGIYRWSDGRVFDGIFREDKRHGKGRFVWPDGAEYEGGFVNGQREGHGVYKFSDGGRYEGGWKDGRYNGWGICSWQDGRTYKGEWLNGMAHGKGMETFADGSVRHDGLWIEDEPVTSGS